jgi:hypothetical protein
MNMTTNINMNMDMDMNTVMGHGTWGMGYGAQSMRHGA